MKAIIFDMDGVLVNSEPAHYISDAEALNLFGANVKPDDMVGYSGIGVGDFFELMRARYGVRAEIEELVRLKNRFLIRELKTSLHSVPGVERLLTGVRLLPLRRALASSSYREVVDTVLVGMGLVEWFETTVAGDEVANAKPAPDIFLKAAQELHVHPEDCVVIEDSDNGICAAKTAGMKAIGFVSPESGPQDFSHADYVVASLPEALPILAEMNLCVA